MVSTINCHLVIIFMVVLAIRGEPDARKMTLVTAALHRPMASGGHHCTLAYTIPLRTGIQYAYTCYHTSTHTISKQHKTYSPCSYMDGVCAM